MQISSVYPASNRAPGLVTLCKNCNRREDQSYRSRNRDHASILARAPNNTQTFFVWYSYLILSLRIYSPADLLSRQSPRVRSCLKKFLEWRTRPVWLCQLRTYKVVALMVERPSNLCNTSQETFVSYYVSNFYTFYRRTYFVLQSAVAFFFCFLDGLSCHINYGPQDYILPSLRKL